MKKRIRSYRDLVVWQKAHGLAKMVIEICKTFPSTDEARIIKNQLIRSCTSVPANIAEGYSGNKGKAYSNSLTIARKESTETDYWLLLSYELGFIGEDKHISLEKGYSEVRAMLSSLIARLEE